MKAGHRNKKTRNETGVANMIEYIMVSGVLMGLLIVMMLLVNTNILEAPADRLTYVAFADIGNGISTRIVDVYAVAPQNGTINTTFDIPDDIAGKDYFVEIGEGPNPVDQDVRVSRGYLQTEISLAGVGATRGVNGSTTGKGLNMIRYDSRSFNP
jgi:hypothetical protein